MNTLPVTVERSLVQGATWRSLEALQPEIGHAYQHFQLFRTDIESQISVLNHLAFPTPDARWWQATREQVMVWESLGRLSLQWRRNELSIRRLEWWERLGLLSAKARIDLDEYRLQRAEMERIALNYARELQMWSRRKAEAELENPTIDKNSPDSHQLVSYAIHYCKRMAHADENMTGAERDNLVGQWSTTVALCIERGVWNDVKKQIPVAVAMAAEELCGLSPAPKTNEREKK